MNPLNLISSALGVVGSAIAGTPSTAESAAGNGSEFGLSSGGDVSSGGGNADPSTGFSGTNILLLGGAGIAAFLLWKHFAK